MSTIKSTSKGKGSDKRAGKHTHKLVDTAVTQKVMLYVKLLSAVAVLTPRVIAI